MFLEIGLVDEEVMQRERSPAPTILKQPKAKHLRPARTVRFRSKNDIFGEQDADAHEDEDDAWETDTESDEDDALPRIQSRHSAVSHKLYRLGMLALVLALMLPIVQISSATSIGVRGGAIPKASIEPTVSRLETRQDSTQVCRRWAGQCRLLQHQEK